MSRTLIASAALATVLGLGGHLQQLSERIVELERDARVEATEVSRLERELAAVRDEAGRARAQAADDARELALEQGLQQLAQRNARAGEELDAFRQRLTGWESVWRGHAPEGFEARIAALREELETSSQALDALAARAAAREREESDRLTELREAVLPLTRGRDVDGMWSELVGPVVQLAGDATVGSGVLLESRPQADGRWLTYLLTSWHVVRDIYGSLERTSMPVPVKIYLPDGGTLAHTAHMVEFDVPLDIALLTLDSDEPVPCGARLASRERVRSVRVFDRVYAVGCPLGNDPIPTAGEIAATRHEVDGGSYWMISAPTYIGNSGGGIFDGETHELLGIFSKIYTHGALRSTIVPHMGLVTPLSVVYGWLDEVGQSQVVDSQLPREELGQARTASATLR